MRAMSHISTGLEGLDAVIDWLKPGDNVVWQVDDIRDYRDIARRFVARAIRDKRKVVYLRFARHEPLVEDQEGLSVFRLEAGEGFESFSTRVHTIITSQGEGAFYVFDSLSDLLTAWATDLMIGNFFLITCPYLFELKTVAYFALVRNRHSYATVARIRETTQVLLDGYNLEGSFYVQPLKVWKRYSPTMFLPHLEKEGKFVPVTSSVDASRLLTHLSRFVDSSRRNLDYWDRLFMQAEELTSPGADPEERSRMIDRLCELMITRDPRMAALVKEHLSLEDFLDIKARLIGSGFIGGKTVGLLLARKLLANDPHRDWSRHLEPHDSFYIGSDVFYSFLVNNGCWKLHMEQKTPEGFFWVAPVLADRILHSVFPEDIKEHFYQIIEYFGQSPIIVRSSSLLEDSFGNAFAGKYLSVFCANQGSPGERYERFEEAIRRIFASTMSEDALVYRRQRGLELHDEQMALLVQRVSGSYHGGFFFPDIGGVGVSYNTFVWKEGMDPRAGMLRIVFGLGTRAVDRVEGDYPRLVALDDPARRPLAGLEDQRAFSQHKVDLIDTQRNELKTMAFIDLLREGLDIPLERITRPDEEANQRLRELGRKDGDVWIITFDDFLAGTGFAELMQSMLKTLEKRYDYPVEIEFTVNFTGPDDYRVNLVQCRPLQTIGQDRPVDFPARVPDEKVLLRMNGNFMGGSISQPISRIIWVESGEYLNLPLQGKYDVARVVGELNRLIPDRASEPVMLLGPGRWGTTTPSLGVPVRFSDISNITVLGEIAFIEGNLMPELSFGTHFFQDLVENGIFFVAVFPRREGVFFNPAWLKGLRSIFLKLLPDERAYAGVVKVYDVRGMKLRVVSDVVQQRVMCFRDD
ncbi:MAG: PEP/pyruvate-binding domain-containing protein [Desulfomonilia bacterium]